MHYHRNDREEYVAYLAEKFPKCFFVRPAQRLPLKKNIVNDLKQTGLFDDDRVAETLNWYTSDFDYWRNHVAGSPRVDLEGNSVGTVTPREQEEARRCIEARKKELAQGRELKLTIQSPPRVTPAIVTVNTRFTNGKTEEMSKTATPTLDPALHDIRLGVDVVAGLLSDKTYAPMRSTLATTALNHIIGRAQTLIQSLAATDN